MRFRVGFKEVLPYLLPILVFTAVFFFFPLLFTVPVSLVKWDGISKMQFVGLSNFRSIWQDPTFKTALVNTLYWIVAAIFLHVPLGLLIALILRRQPRGWRFFRTIFFLPNVVSVSSLAIIWYFLLNPRFGLVNHLLKAVGLGKWARPWLSDPATALFATQVPFVLYIGFTMLIFLAQMTAIPRDYYEAAEIDGASKWQQDLYITIPLVRRAIGINILFNGAFVLRMIEYPMIMTGGGPAGLSLTLPPYMYEKMTTAYDYGAAMAVGTVTLVIGALVVVLVLLGLRSLESRWG